MKNKVIFVGDERIHQGFVNMEPDWDFQIPMKSLEDFNDDLDKADDEALLSKDSSLIIIFSRLFDNNPELFATTVAYYAPYAAICILTPSADADKVPNIESAIRLKQRAFESNPEIATNSETPFYFVSYETPKADIVESLAKYMQDPLGSESAKENIKNLIPSHFMKVIEDEYEQFDDNEEFEESDEIVIPEAAPGALGQVVAVTSSKGGSGKSTVSITLGSYLAKGSKLAYEQGLEEDPLKVVLVDLDTRDGQLGFLTGKITPNVFNIIEASSGESLTHEAIRSGIVHNENLECDFIYAVRRPRHAKSIPASFYASLIQELRSMYDIIILDTSVNYLNELLEKIAYPISDSILLVTDMSIPSIYGMARWISETTKPEDKGGSGIDKNKIGIVVNKTLPDVAMSAEQIEKAASGIPIVAFLPSAPKLFTYSANTNSLDRVLERKQVNKSFKNLADAIVEPIDYKLSELPYQDD